jgi:hypothetical protein
VVVKVCLRHMKRAKNAKGAAVFVCVLARKREREIAKERERERES